MNPRRDRERGGNAMKRALAVTPVLGLLAVLLLAGPAPAQLFKDEIYQRGPCKPVDSKIKVKVGQPTPDFTLPSVKGEKVSLRQFRGQKNVVISFLPEAWTPVCSEQWPGYNLAREVFTERDTIILGVTVDNLGTLHAWTQGMGGLWFPVLSDFWPHGEVAQRYGVLRGDGMAERALIVVDKKGVIRYIDIHDINTRPDLTLLVRALDLITKGPVPGQP
jgi:peroxiredoxin (alkyl hydroperoxide reductase subunit C)